MINKNLNILHVVGSKSSEGAALGAKVLHDLLLKEGVNSFILFLDSSKTEHIKNCVNDNSFVQKIYSFFLCRLESKILSFLFLNREKYIFTTGLLNWSLERYVKKYNIDVINIHWPGYGGSCLKYFKTKKIVFTMRDMWLSTAGCHIPTYCSNYKNSCLSCPALGPRESRFKDFLTFNLFHKKREIFLNNNNVAVVAISKLVSEFMWNVNSSDINLRVIDNLIDFEAVSKFINLGSQCFPDTFAVNSRSISVLIPKISREPWKGHSLVASSIEFLKNDFAVSQFGRGVPYPDVADLGFMENFFDVLSAYSNSDVLIFPSILEPFGKVILESGAVGTPVVIDRYAKVGVDENLPFIFKCDIKNYADLKATLFKARAAKINNIQHGNFWFNEIKKRYNTEKIIQSYLELYDELCTKDS